MRDLLIRYLLGELNEAELHQLEERLLQSPELRRELDYLRACFTEGGEAAPAANEPPVDLARRTSQQVSSLSGEFSAASQPNSTLSSIEPPAASSSWGLADISVAAGVFLAVSMLLLPALRGSRDSSRRVACANNLRTIGQHLINYAEWNHGYFPRVKSRDCAGVFAYRLVADGYTTPDEMKRLLVCPASKQRDVYAKAQIIVTMPRGDTLAPEQIVQLVRVIPISYAYRLGYVDNDKYHCIRKPRSCQPIMADAPRFDANGPAIANHGGCGVNVLNADCSVRWQKCMTVAGLDDMLYLNSQYKAAAGQGPNDIVLAGSEATPSVEIEVIEAE